MASCVDTVDGAESTWSLSLEIGVIENNSVDHRDSGAESALIVFFFLNM